MARTDQKKPQNSGPREPVELAHSRGSLSSLARLSLARCSLTFSLGRSSPRVGARSASPEPVPLAAGVRTPSSELQQELDPPPEDASLHELAPALPPREPVPPSALDSPPRELAVILPPHEAASACAHHAAQPPVRESVPPPDLAAASARARPAAGSGHAAVYARVRLDAGAAAASAGARSTTNRVGEKQEVESTRKKGEKQGEFYPGIN